MRAPSYHRHADGIILPGHEGYRLDLALRQLTPQRAVVVMIDLTVAEVTIAARTANAGLLHQLNAGQRPNWRLESVTFNDPPEILQRMARHFAEQSVALQRRIVLYPFGPKIALLAVTLGALQTTRGDVYLVSGSPFIRRGVHRRNRKHATTGSLTSPAGATTPTRDRRCNIGAVIAAVSRISPGCCSSFPNPE